MIIDSILWSLLWWGHSQPCSWIHGLWKHQHGSEDHSAGSPASLSDPSHTWVCHISHNRKGKDIIWQLEW